MDAVDRILLKESAAALSGLSASEVTVIDDASGGLAVGAARLAQFGPTAGRLRVCCDLLADETRVVAEAATAGVPLDLQLELGNPLLHGVSLVLLRLPKSLAALDEITAAVARWATPQVQLLAGGRIKHMTLGMNRVLARHFTSVSASLGQQHSRVLVASGPMTTETLSYPACRRHEDLGLTVCAHGAAFAGNSVDLGTRLLLSYLPEMNQHAESVVDLGCGTGVLAAVVARRTGVRVTAVDESTAASRSAAATAASNGVADRMDVRRAHLLTGCRDGSVDLVLCNPPFHRGTARDSDVAFAMFADAGRALAPTGELWTVYNSHLPYLPALGRLVGPTRIVGRDRNYLVTCSTAGRGDRQPPTAGAAKA